MLDRHQQTPPAIRFSPSLSTESVLRLPVREAVAAAEGRTGWVSRVGAYRPAEPPARGGRGPADRERRSARADRRPERGDRSERADACERNDSEPSREQGTDDGP